MKLEPKQDKYQNHFTFNWHYLNSPGPWTRLKAALISTWKWRLYWSNISLVTVDWRAVTAAAVDLIKQQTNKQILGV